MLNAHNDKQIPISIGVVRTISHIITHLEPRQRININQNLLKSLEQTIQKLLVSKNPHHQLSIYLYLAEILMKIRTQAKSHHHTTLARSLEPPILECLNQHSRQFER